MPARILARLSLLCTEVQCKSFAKQHSLLCTLVQCKSFAKLHGKEQAQCSVCTLNSEQCSRFTVYHRTAKFSTPAKCTNYKLTLQCDEKRNDAAQQQERGLLVKFNSAKKFFLPAASLPPPTIVSLHHTIF